MKKNNRGFTLVELICVCAILGVVTVSIFSFMLSGSGMANQTKKSLALSENSRTTIHRMKEDILDAGAAIAGDGTTSSGGATSFEADKPFYFVKSERTSDDPSQDTYTILSYKYDTTDANNKKLYYGRTTGVTLSGAFNASGCEPTHVLCENIDDFSIKVYTFGMSTAASTYNIVTRADITLNLSKNNKSFYTDESVGIRSQSVYVTSLQDVVSEIKKKTAVSTESDGSATASDGSAI